MKKNYYMVLVALFSFALNAFAQEDKWETVTSPDATDSQVNAYNMVITLPDGTTFTVNTDDVDEVQFSNGQVSVSGTSIQQLLTYCEKIQAEQDKLLGTVHALVTDESVLHVLLEDNKRAYEELQDYVKDLSNKLDTLNVSGEFFSDILKRLVGLETYAPLITQEVEQALYLGREATDLAEVAQATADKNAAYLAQQTAAVQGLAAKIDVISMDATDLANRVAGLADRLSKAEAAIEENNIVDLGKRITALETNFSILGIDVQEALQTARGAYAKVQSNEALLNNLKNEQAALWDALHSHDTAQDAEINNQMTMIATLKGIINDLLDRVQKLESK